MTMYCTNCGKPRDANASVCLECGRPVERFAAPAPGAAGGQIPNYLVHSILVTLCCCLPFGIVAIIYSAQVNSKLAGGDVTGAMQSSKNAKIWAWVAFACGAIPAVLYAILMGIGAIAEQ